MSHTCTNALVRCMDFRLGPQFRRWLDEKGYSGDIDEISIAGACKSFVALDNRCAAEFLMGQIDISIKLHQISRLILTQHTSCGGYGGSEAFASPEAEKIKLTNDMRALCELVRNKYPELEIVQVLLQRVDDANWQFQEVTA